MKADSAYWDKVYKAKSETDVSWFQEVPARSLELIDELQLKAEDSILDVGGGDSRLVDHLISKGFTDISVLDISAAALERAKLRLGEKSKYVKFLASDITKFIPTTTYRLWHDRATLHFLTNSEDISSYLEIANRAIAPDGFLIVSTFARTGPDKCSGLKISQYSDQDLKSLFSKHFENIKCFEDTHTTPWKTPQVFVYCGFKKKNKL